MTEVTYPILRTAGIDGMLVTGLNGQAQAQLRLEEMVIDLS